MKRNLTGILLLNKSEGMTSNSALQTAKRLFEAKKAGHTGTLDPLAEGMLCVCFGEATKFAQYFIANDKVYRVKAVLGTQMDSGDRTGAMVSEKPVPTLTHQDIQTVLNRFVGQIKQVPPMYSALKVQGKRLYTLARKGIDVDRPAREITIHHIALEHFSQNETETTLTLTVSCSKGTYIRTLVEDIALALGTVGHVNALYRHCVGHFNPNKMVSLEQIEAAKEVGQEALDQLLLPFEQALPPDWPKIALDPHAAFCLQRGQTVTVPDLPSEGLVQVWHENGALIGIGEMEGPTRMAPKRLMRLEL